MTPAVDSSEAERRRPVTDWCSDYDIFDPGYIEHPYDVWSELRATCPVAHTSRWGGSWMPTRYQDVQAVAHDAEHFSSRQVTVVDTTSGHSDPLPGGLPRLAPIQADAPLHTWTRRLLLPWFSHSRVAELEAPTWHLCNELIDELISYGSGDAAADYAQQIPVRVIAEILKIPAALKDTFTDWVRDLVEFAYDQERRSAAEVALAEYLRGVVAERREAPGEDSISELLRADVDGAPVTDEHVVGICALVIIAGVDTTWSAIGCALWHLATHPEDCRRLATEPELMPTAVEELLRAYSPVTMARAVTADVEIDGCPMARGDRVLLNFPAANRDPQVFANPDSVVLDRSVNRHLAFGAGIHRCAGSNLARMELQIAIQSWLSRIPTFRLADEPRVTWAGGQVRGPRRLPVVLG